MKIILTIQMISLVALGIYLDWKVALIMGMASYLDDILKKQYETSPDVPQQKDGS